MARVHVQIARNFDRNLDRVAEHLGQGSTVFADLMDHLLGDMIPNLERFPRLGVDLLARPARSTETRAIKRRLLRLVGAGYDLREYISGDYLVLYALHKSTVHLLAIRHHRELSFDLAGHWEPGPT